MTAAVEIAAAAPEVLGNAETHLLIEWLRRLCAQADLSRVTRGGT